MKWSPDSRPSEFIYRPSCSWKSRQLRGGINWSTERVIYTLGLFMTVSKAELFISGNFEVICVKLPNKQCRRLVWPHSAIHISNSFIFMTKFIKCVLLVTNSAKTSMLTVQQILIDGDRVLWSNFTRLAKYLKERGVLICILCKGVGVAGEV